MELTTPLIGGTLNDMKGKLKSRMEALMKTYSVSTPLKSKEFLGHTGVVWTCAISLDNQYVFTGSADKLVKVWNASSGSLISNLAGHTDVVFIVNITSDDKRLVSGGWDFKVIVWDWMSQVIETVISVHTHQVYCLAFTDDNKFLVSGGADQYIHIWDLEGKSEVGKISFGIYIFSVALTNGNKEIIAAGGEGKYSIFNFTTHVLVSSHLPGAGIIQSITLTPDNKFIGFGTQNNLIKIYNYPANTEYCTFTSHENQVRNVAFTSDNTYLISTSSDKTIRIFNIVTKKEELKLEGSGGYIYGQFMSRDGQYLVTSATDKIANLWKIGTKQRLRKLAGHTAAMRCHTISSDSQFVFTGSDDKTIRKWNIADGTFVSEIRGLSGNVMALLVTEDMKYIINAGEDTKVNVWDFATNTLKIELKHDISFVACLAATKDNKFFVSSGGDMQISLWDLSTLTLVKRLEGHTNAVFAITFTNDGSKIVTGSADKTIRIWDMNNLGQSVKYETGTAMINCIALNNDNTLLALGCRDNCAYLWDFTEKKMVKKLAKHTGWIQGVHFSEDGNSVVTAGMDTIARVWNAKEEILDYELKGHTASVRWAEFTRNGNYIVTVGHDKIVNIWDIKNIDELELVDISGPIDSFLYLANLKKRSQPKDFNYQALFSPLKVNLLHIYSFLGFDDLLAEALQLGVDIRIDNDGKSPLWYALVRKSQNCIDLILDFMTELKGKNFELFLNYSYALRGDFEILLDNRSANLPGFLEAIFFKVPNITNFAIPKYNLPYLFYSTVKTVNPYNFIYRSNETPEDASEVPLEFKTLPFAISYIKGSSGSIDLLDSISNCPNKQILRTGFVYTYIRDKWNALWRYILALTILMWSNLILMTILLILTARGDTDTVYFIAGSIGFLFVNLLLISYEILQAFSAGGAYFYDILNLVDIVRITLCLSWLILNLYEPEEYVRYIAWPMALVNFFRGLSGFRAFDTTRYYTRLITKAFSDSIAFLLVFFYSTLAFGVVYLAANPKSDFTVISLWSVPYELSMGDFSTNNSDFLEYTGFILATIINVVIILNLLISILGDSFEKFQSECQEIDCLDMAELVTELETLMYWNRETNEKMFLQQCTDLGAEGVASWEGRLKAVFTVIDGVKKQSEENYQLIQELAKANTAKMIAKNDETIKIVNEKYDSLSSKTTEILNKLNAAG